MTKQQVEEILLSLHMNKVQQDAQIYELKKMIRYLTIELVDMKRSFSKQKARYIVAPNFNYDISKQILPNDSHPTDGMDN